MAVLLRRLMRRSSDLGEAIQVGQPCLLAESHTAEQSWYAVQSWRDPCLQACMLRVCLYSMRRFRRNRGKC